MTVVVLKFGGSVLEGEDSLRRAVHEIYRWRRQGRQVLAVVSALRGRTAGLIATADRCGAGPGSGARAALVTLGESESAALLGLHLERAGLPCSILEPGAVGLVAAGPALDAIPERLDAGPFRRALEADGIVVFPGYCAVDTEGRRVALGRGGSDLTAVFLAAELGAACCRLIKDVDGLYEHDPARSGPAPARYRAATWEDALATDGSIIQHRAVDCARTRAYPFELGALNSDTPTRIGAAHTQFEPAPAPPAPLRVGLLGHGTVGGGVAELTARQPDVLVELTGDPALADAAADWPTTEAVMADLRDPAREREALPHGVH